MSDFIKLIVATAIIWTLWLAAHIAAAIIGTFLALWGLYFFTRVVNEELENDAEKPE